MQGRQFHALAPDYVSITMVRFALLLAAVSIVRADNGAIEGTIVNDTNGVPLRRAYVVLRAAEAGVAPIGIDADDQGHFAIRDIPAGQYSLLAQRDGFLTSNHARLGGFRLPVIFKLQDGQHLSGVEIRLRPWAVVAGRVRFGDGEPAVGVSVQVYREVHYLGRHNYVVVGGARTDDRGEYRVHGLPAGAFFVVAVYERPALVPGAEEQAPLDAYGQPAPVETYTSTFFPGSYKLTEARPVQLETGREIDGIDIFLQRVRKVTIHGRVTSGLSGEVIRNPTVTLERTDVHGTGGLSLPVTLSTDRQGRFELKDVTPGPYVLGVDASEQGTPLAARLLMTVGESPIDDLAIVARPEQEWLGRVSAEGSGRIRLGSLRIRLDPRSPRGSVLSAHVERDGSFKLLLLPDETYDIYVEGAPADFYLKSARVGNNDLLLHGVSSSYASDTVPLVVTLSSAGARIMGRVFTAEGSVVTGASLTLIPDPPSGRYQAYRNATADEYAYFQILGVPPGRYLLLSWMDEPPCDFYDDSSLDACRPFGVPLTVEGDNSSYNVPVEFKEQ